MKKFKDDKMISILGGILITQYIYLAISFVKVFTSVKTYEGIALSFKNGFFIEMLILFIIGLVLEYISKKNKIDLTSFKKIGYIVAGLIFIVGMEVLDNNINTNFIVWLINIISWVVLVTILPLWIINIKNKKNRVLRVVTIIIIAILNISLPTSINAALAKTIFRSSYYTSQSFYNAVVDTYNSNKRLYPYILNINNEIKEISGVKFEDFSFFNVHDANKLLENNDVNTASNSTYLMFVFYNAHSKDSYEWDFSNIAKLKNDNDTKKDLGLKLVDSSCHELKVKNNNERNIRIDLKNSELDNVSFAGKITPVFLESNIGYLNISTPDTAVANLTYVEIEKQLEVDNKVINLNGKGKVIINNYLYHKDGNVFFSPNNVADRKNIIHLNGDVKIIDLTISNLNVEVTDINNNIKNMSEVLKKDNIIRLYYTDSEGKSIDFIKLIVE